MSCGITTHVVSVEWPLKIETIKTSNDRVGYRFIFGAITQFGAFQTQFKGERILRLNITGDIPSERSEKVLMAK